MITQKTWTIGDITMIIEPWRSRTSQVQCNNCHLFRHRSGDCNYEKVCATCGMTHTEQCKSTKQRCANCYSSTNNNHRPDGPECPVYRRIMKVPMPMSSANTQPNQVNLTRTNIVNNINSNQVYRKPNQFNNTRPTQERQDTNPNLSNTLGLSIDNLTKALTRQIEKQDKQYGIIIDRLDKGEEMNTKRSAQLVYLLSQQVEDKEAFRIEAAGIMDTNILNDFDKITQQRK